MARDNGGIIGPVNDPTNTSASGVWSLEEQYQAQLAGNWPSAPAPFSTNSLRFDDGSSDNLSRNTWGTPTNNKKFTMSVWVKRTTLGATQQIVNSYVGSGNDNQLKFKNTDAIELTVSTSSTEYFLKTNRLFRDVSAWYHIVFAFDSTQGTDSNRYKLYVNGTQETSFSAVSYPPQDTTYQFFNNSNANRIGIAHGGSAEPFDGYMSEFIFIDGQQLDPTSFGVSDANGVWTPIKYTGTFGTNGFQLQFGNAAALGTDSSINENNFTVNNLTSIDQTTDYPVNNFATLNSVFNLSGTLSEGNLKYATSTSYGSQGNTATPTLGVSEGKWYAEFKCGGTTGTFPNGMVGVYYNPGDFQDGETNPAQSYDEGFGYAENGVIYNNGSTSTGTTYTDGDIIGIALDCDGSKVYWYKNGVLVNAGGTTIDAGETYFFFIADTSGSGGTTFESNFGNPPFTISSGNSDAEGYGNFEYAVPSGYYALCTKNLAEYG